MRLRPIGYYVHHHGAGHRARADAIASAIDWPVVLLGTGIGGAGIDLPDDRPRSKQFDGADDAVSRPGSARTRSEDDFLDCCAKACHDDHRCFG